MRLITCLFSLLLTLPLFSQPAAKNTDPEKQYQAALKTIARSFSNDLYPNYASFYSLPEKDFIRRIDSARQAFFAVLRKFENDLPSNFAKQQELEIKYYFDKLLIDYPLNHSIYSGKAPGKRSAIAGRLKENLADLNKPELLGNSDFLNYVRSFFAYQAAIEIKKPAYKKLDNQQLAIAWKLITQFISNPQCRDFWQAEYLYQHIDNNGIKNIQGFYNEFRSSCRDTASLNRITALYSEDLAGRQGHSIKTYKTVDGYDLDLHIFSNDSFLKGPKRPVIVYFHGGSWSEGKPDWFFPACEALAAKGWVACAVEYRTYGRHGSLPFAAVMDARSAIRWLRKQAKDWNIDTSRIVASGNSAGGHLALCTALAYQWNEKTDDLSFSPVPNLLLVNSGVYDLTDQATAWIRRDLKNKDLVKQISPDYLTIAQLPPTLIIHGTNDQNVPFSSAQKFVEMTKAAGITTLEFAPLDKAGHFIWYDPNYSSQVSRLRADFLVKYGY